MNPYAPRTRCKPGDVCIIIKKIEFNIGRLVVVESAHGWRDFVEDGRLFCWNIESMGGKLQDSLGQLMYRGNIPDIALQPVRDMNLDSDQIASLKADHDFMEAAYELLEIVREYERTHSEDHEEARDNLAFG